MAVAVGEELVKQNAQAPHVRLVGELGGLCDGLWRMPGTERQAKVLKGGYGIGYSSRCWGCVAVRQNGL